MKTVKTYDGENEIDVKGYQETLRNFPQTYHAQMSDDGRPYLSGAVQSDYPCGCKIIGCGTLQFPLSIQFCKKHK